MSGSTVQRGDLACFDKWTRANSALLNGIDLVVELPTVNVLSSAKRFATSSVYLLNKLNVNALSFGSESGDIKLLCDIASACIEIENSTSLKKYVTEGMSYPHALTYAISQQYGQVFADTLNNPNNLLAIEYIKATKIHAPHMELFTLKREQANHDSMETGDNISSASYIRKNLLVKEKFIPNTASELYNSQLEQGYAPILLSNIERAILIKLRQMSAVDFLKLADVSNGLEHRLVNASKTAKSLEEFYLNAKSKSIPHARIRRIVLNAFLDITEELTKTLPQYARILGMNKNGMECLKALKKSKSDFLVSPKFASLYKDANPLEKKLLDIDIKATDISMVACDNIQISNIDFIKNTIIL